MPPAGPLLPGAVIGSPACTAGPVCAIPVNKRYPFLSGDKYLSVGFLYEGVGREVVKYLIPRDRLERDPPRPSGMARLRTVGWPAHAGEAVGKSGWLHDTRLSRRMRYFFALARSLHSHRQWLPSCLPWQRPRRECRDERSGGYEAPLMAALWAAGRKVGARTAHPPSRPRGRGDGQDRRGRCPHAGRIRRPDASRPDPAAG